MGKLNKISLLFSIFYLSISFNCFLFIEPTSAQETLEKLSQTRYVDPKGYFKITPPLGWRIIEYPEEQRGKVGFITAKDADLRCLARGADFNSFEDLIKFVKDIEKQMGVNTNIQKISFLGRSAVQRNFFFKGVKLLMIDFMEGNIKHNLQYSAPKDKYDKYLAVATMSMNTYQTILHNASAEEIRKHELSQNLRLAQLSFERGNRKLALEFVKQGLEIEPKNSDLLKLKKQIENEGNRP